MLYQIYFYVPEESLEAVKNAMFEAGAGQAGDYEQCAWQILGEGQFKPSKNAKPYIGQQEKLTKLNEYRVEMICPKSELKSVLTALIAAHPYQEVAYGALPILTLDELDDR
jgi:hypothetical protein